MSVAWVGVAATVAGAAMSAKASGDAADAQSEAAANSDATQRYQYDTTRADNKPFLANGTAASNRLAYMLGLSPNSTGGALGGASNFTARDLIDTSSGDWKPNQGLYASDPAYAKAWDGFMSRHLEQFGVAPADYRGSNVDVALKQLGYDPSQANQQAQAQQTRANGDPAYGSLMRKFTMADRDADPVYQSGLQFGLNEGTKGINRQAAANGSFLSGATLKALTRFGNDYGSTKANESYNRFNNDQTQQYNRLAGVAGSGQNASQQIGVSGMNMANQIAASQQGVGNARASGYITQSNALQNGLNGAVSGYRNMQTGNSLTNYGGAGITGGGGFGTGVAFGNQDYGNYV